MTRPLTEDEAATLLASDTVARLATIDASGYAHVTPLWFLWADGAFHLPATPDGPTWQAPRHPEAGLVIDVVAAQRPDRQWLRRFSLATSRAVPLSV
jgi:nitroimidazol reductase NimA-like FMN-containing flavoprotein (pyridoxamine 5'-phosphate oxidase superfamily)